MLMRKGGICREVPSHRKQEFLDKGYCEAVARKAKKKHAKTK